MNVNRRVTIDDIGCRLRVFVTGIDAQYGVAAGEGVFVIPLLCGTLVASKKRFEPPCDSGFMMRWMRFGILGLISRTSFPGVYVNIAARKPVRFELGGGRFSI